MNETAQEAAVDGPARPRQAPGQGCALLVLSPAPSGRWPVGRRVPRQVATVPRIRRVVLVGVLGAFLCALRSFLVPR
ncbi:hypothetical protein ACFOZ0_16970 [Streptomyces yaanensis]|uniref:Uncharacterized protein n=1 Tax=Streptomyces yaanensis TaxID=1142239 RepID=A0ABV7SDA3_9ACTN|nr:hypothetical protein [Streptomyces sp. CGMCC 4.7035]WNB98258.1 hypothetical protein Q2K21_09330 [Streptomyces sp. CGMCC 4.7035]